MHYKSVAQSRPLTLKDIVELDDSSLTIKEVEKGSPYGNDFALTIEHRGHQIKITSETIKGSAKKRSDEGVRSFLNPLEDFGGIVEFVVKKDDVIKCYTKIAHYYVDPKKRVANFIDESDDFLKKYRDENFLPPQHRAEVLEYNFKLYQAASQSIALGEASKDLCDQIYNSLLFFRCSRVGEKFFKKDLQDSLSKLISQIESTLSREAFHNKQFLFGDDGQIGVFHDLIRLSDSIEKMTFSKNSALLELEEMLENLFYHADISKCNEICDEEYDLFSSTVDEFAKFYLSHKNLHCDSLTNLSLACVIDNNVCPNLDYVRNYKVGILSNFSFYWIFSIICIAALLDSSAWQLGWLWLTINIVNDVKDVAAAKALNEVIEPISAFSAFPIKGFKKNLRCIVIASAISNLKLIREEITKNLYSKTRIGERLRKIEASGYRLPSAIYEILELH